MTSIGRPYRPQDGIRGDFDAIVIGSGMGGLSVASLLAQQGRRVLLLEQHFVIGGLTQSYTRRGYRFSVGLHYIGELGSPQTATYKLFDRVTAGGIEWAPLPPIFNRMLIADREYAIPAGAPAYREALVGAFPNETEAIDTYLGWVREASKASNGYFAQKALPEIDASAYASMTKAFHEFSDRSTIDALSELTDDEELIAVLCANWGDYSLEPSKSSFAMHCMLAKHYMNGGHYPVGGGQSLARAIVPIIESAGGEVLFDAEVAEIEVAHGAVQGVRMTSGELVRCPVVVSNAGVQNTYGRLLDPSAARSSGLQSLLERVRDTYACVGLNIGLSRPGAELGFDAANIWAHPGPDFEANLAAHRADFEAPFPWTFITFPSMKDPEWDEEFPDRSVVEMYAYTDFAHFERWSGTDWRDRGREYESIKDRIRDRLLEKLFDYVPAARSAIDLVEVSTPLTYERFVKRARGGFMGVESSPARFRQHWLRAPSPISGLYLSGQDVATDGIIGALVGGVIAASSILGRDLMSEIRHPASSAG